jgi:glycosyltransferase involved in cell wall biosynthesis
MKISIITPVFNGENVIKDLICSILDQDHKNWELIVQDGKSTDNTVDIIQAFSDSRIKVFSEKDNGMYDAINRGIARSTGEFILHLNSDEQLLEDALKVIVREIKDNNIYDVYCFGVLVINKDREPKVFRKAYPQSKLFLKLYNIDIFTAGIVYKKKVFNNLKFKTNYKTVSDALLFYDILKNDYKVFYSNSYTSLFLSEGENLSFGEQAIKERNSIRNSLMLPTFSYNIFYYFRKLYKIYHKCHVYNSSKEIICIYHNGEKLKRKTNNITYRLNWHDFN